MLKKKVSAANFSMWLTFLFCASIQSVVYAQQQPVPAPRPQLEDERPPRDNRNAVASPGINNVPIGNLEAPARTAENPADRDAGNGRQRNGERATDQRLRGLIVQQGLNGDPSIGRNLPDVQSPLAQLGKILFFSKSLGGGFDAACVTCHHPALGGTDNLSLSVGVDAAFPDLLGVGRVGNNGLPLVPRNAPTIFNIGLWDSGLFWDSRVESLLKESGRNGADSGIRTPDSPFGVADDEAGDNLVMAQARFPITSAAEMKKEIFENGSDNNAIRSHLAARIGNYGIGEYELPPNMWVAAFQNSYDSSQPVEELVTIDNIVRAISEYQRSMVFIDSPWKRYVDGDNSALSQQQKNGAIAFYTSAGCALCHNGDTFTDERHHTVGFPQIGPGKADGNNDDFGRERETGRVQDRYRFRTPSLLNVGVTAPYGHSGAYATLGEVIRHYSNPQRSVDSFFDDNGVCQLPQFANTVACADFYPDARGNSQLALDKLNREQQAGTARLRNINLDDTQIDELEAFMNALTDFCVLDRDCLSPWIADPVLSGPDGQQLNGVDQSSQPL
jgi:cytochrome c peroxidase